jgi:hypothetical protein
MRYHQAQQRAVRKFSATAAKVAALFRGCDMVGKFAQGGRLIAGE